MCIFIYREREYMYYIYERLAWPGPPAGTGPGIAAQGIFPSINGD